VKGEGGGWIEQFGPAGRRRVMEKFSNDAIEKIPDPVIFSF
jgi:hypothetical protein